MCGYGIDHSQVVGDAYKNGSALLPWTILWVGGRVTLLGAPYSSRSATIGSSFAARLAGSKLAVMATAPKPAAANTKVKGSYGFNPYNNVAADFPTATANT